MTKTPDGLYQYNPRPHGSQEKLVAMLAGRERVLDVGCSAGYLAKRLQEGGATVVGLDVDERSVELAGPFCEAVLVGDVETMELPFEPGSFDAVVCGDVVEHLRDPLAFLRRIRPLLRAGGVLVLSTPNIANWAMRLGLLFGRFRYTDWGLLDRGHTHLFTRKTLAECLDAAGYRITRFDFTVPVPVLSMPPVEAVAHAVGRIRPSLFAYQFVVEAAPFSASASGRLIPTTSSQPAATVTSSQPNALGQSGSRPKSS